MHDLAPLKLASPVVDRWEHARLPARMLTVFDAVHLKAAAEREGDLTSRFGLPGPLTTSLIDGVEALWRGPAEWVLLASAENLESLAVLQGRTAAAGIASAKCGSRLRVLEFDGGSAIFAGLTGLPKEALGPNRVARVRLADVPFMLATNAGDTVRAIFDRTYAPHLRAWLDRAI